MITGVFFQAQFLMLFTEYLPILVTTKEIDSRLVQRNFIGTAPGRQLISTNLAMASSHRRPDFTPMTLNFAAARKIHCQVLLVSSLASCATI